MYSYGNILVEKSINSGKLIFESKRYAVESVLVVFILNTPALVFLYLNLLEGWDMPLFVVLLFFVAFAVLLSKLKINESNLVEIEVDGKDDNNNDANQFDSYIRFVIWWELKKEPNLSDDFYTLDSDGDGVKNYLDYNDEIDVGINVTIDEFGIVSNYDEYMNLEVFINGDSRYLLGQTGDSIHIQGGQMQSFDESFFFDISYFVLK